MANDPFITGNHDLGGIGQQGHARLAHELLTN